MNKMRMEINSIGTVFEGNYSEVIVNGSAKFEGAITSEIVSVNGSAKSYFPLETDLFTINGIFKGEDNVKANSLVVNGSFKGEKDVRVKKLVIDGVFKNEGVLNADNIELNGSLKNEVEINVDRFVVNGVLKANDIVGKDIAILKNAGVSFLRLNTAKTIRSKAENITCENVYARSLKCNKICADDITLKDGCVVEFVECNGVLRLDGTCIVKNVVGTCEIIHEN